MDIAHESRLERFLTFIASICWNLDNLVLAPLPLEVQSWRKWQSPLILLTSADMTALGHCSRQVENGRKLMRQSLVHPLEIPLCPPNHMFPIFSPLGFMDIAHESRLERFLIFIVSICWNLDNLVLASLPLEVQSWGRWRSPFFLLTLADMTALGHCSCQVEGGRKLMGQSLVHPQRLDPLVWGSSCFFG